MSDANDIRGQAPRPVGMSAPRLPLPALLWIALALAYLLASASGHRALAIGIVGLMFGTVLAVSGLRLVGAVTALVMVAAAILATIGAGDSLSYLAILAYLPPLAAFAFMAWFFGRTLRSGADALITRVARKEHAVLPEEIARYTRTLTQIWTACFVLLCLLALLLALLLPLPQWSRWVHGLGYVLPAVLFIGEYIFRHRYFRDREHHGLLRLIANILLVIKESALETQPRQAKPDDASREPR